MAKTHMAIVGVDQDTGNSSLNMAERGKRVSRRGSETNFFGWCWGLQYRLVATDSLESRGSGIENKRVTGKTFIRFRGPQALIGQGRVTARAFGPNQ